MDSGRFTLPVVWGRESIERWVMDEPVGRSLVNEVGGRWGRVSRGRCDGDSDVTIKGRIVIPLHAVK